jgi:endonuclease III
MSSFEENQTRNQTKKKTTKKKKTKTKMKARTKKMTMLTTKTATRSQHGNATAGWWLNPSNSNGAPAPPPSADPLELIIGEDIAHLANDKCRAEAFAILKHTIGTRPDQILAARHSALAAIGKAGILPDLSAEKLLTIAKIAHEEFQTSVPCSVSHCRKPKRL